MSSYYTYRQGETIIVALDVMSGDESTVTAISAAIALLDRGDEELSQEEVDNAIPMIVTARPAVGDIPVGWDFSLTPALSAALEPGKYRVDATLTIGSGEEITSESARVRITRAATSPASE